ncbi:hypothetical protein APE01nite_09780 [Acetobacter peroxydans]|uniref:Uncharacterized protein n=1 Tax=Acetobacter peroxydans TaxID=104098 RepID=A0A4Y3TQ72_9PROT|nr:hypothetical protein APE01nite_09780 [Acetobacter peroxydans]
MRAGGAGAVIMVVGAMCVGRAVIRVHGSACAMWRVSVVVLMGMVVSVLTMFMAVMVPMFVGVVMMVAGVHGHGAIATASACRAHLEYLQIPDSDVCSP